MSSRKKTLVLGSISLLAILGLVIAAGLAAGITSMRSVERPEHLPIGASTRALATSIAYIILTPSTPPASGPAALPPTDAVSPRSNATSLPDNVFIDTSTSSSTATSSPTDALAGLSAPSPTPTAPPADTPTPTPTPTDAPTPTPTPTLTSTPTATPLLPGRITGRVSLDGVPVSQGATLRLEDQAYNMIAETTVDASGHYVFPDLASSSEGYHVSFAQEWNPQYKINQVISWGWIGPVAVENGAVVELPDLDISLRGFGQLHPAPNATVSAAALSPEAPILFEWNAYPQAVAYWVDLAQGEEQEVVWQSSLSQAVSHVFDGTVDSGVHIQPGEYWWGVGSRRDLGPSPLTVYGYLSVLLVEP